MSKMQKTVITAMAAVFAATLVAVPANAQRDPEYAAARANGSVGEKTTGYLGIVGQATPELQSVVNDINIKRKAVYTRRAQEAGVPPDQYATAAGCQAIARTVPGEKYEAPDGSWKTRTSTPPDRLAACP